MDDLRERFATFDRAPVPDLWPTIERRLESSPETVLERPSGAMIRAPQRTVRPGSSMPRRWLVLLAAAVLIASLLGGALITGALRVPTMPSPITDGNVVLPVPTGSIPSDGTNGLVAYITLEADGGEPGRTPDQELWVARADGSAARPILDGLPPRSSGARVFGSPAWTLDGTRLAYTYDGGSYVTDDPFIESVPITVDCAPSCLLGQEIGWAPDGRQIVFIGREGGRSVLYSVALNDGGRVAIAEVGIDTNTPRWSPTGSTIASIEMVQDQTTFLRSFRVWLADVDRGEARLLDLGGLSVDRAEWSPDGSWLALATRAESYVDDAVGDPTVVAVRDIYVVRPDGTDLRRLTSDGLSGDPSWIDGEHIRFEHSGDDDFREFDLQREFWSIRIDGTDVQHLQEHDGLRRLQSDGFSWQPTP